MFIIFLRMSGCIESSVVINTSEVASNLHFDNQIDKQFLTKSTQLLKLWPIAEW